MSNSTAFHFLDNSEKSLENYHQNGFHLEPGVFSAEECQEMIEAAKQLECYKNQVFRPAMMPHRENPIFLKVMRNPRIVKIIAHLVNGTPAGLQSEFFYCPPGTKGFSLHQDNFFVEAKSGYFASAWIALTDVYPEKASLIIYPGSHKEGHLPVKKLFATGHQHQDPNANNEETVVPKQYKPINVAVPQGSVVFIHGEVVHGSNANLSNEWRYVLLCTYIKQGEKFRSGQYAQREPIEL